MFVEKFQDNKIIQAVNRESKSVWALALCALLTVCSACFHMELVCYTLLVAYAVYLLLFADDIFPIIGFIPFLYFSPSVRNNPGTNTNSVFSLQNGLIYIIILVVIFLTVFLLRGIREIKRNKVKLKLPTLTLGFALLGAAYLLGGIGYENYDVRTLLFGFLQIASIAFLYFLYCFFIKSENIPKDYFAWIGFFGGVIISFSVLQWLAMGNVGIKTLYLGWGMFNNVGCALNMCIPCVLYLAYKKDRGWLFLLFAFFLYALTIFTCSRTSAAVGFVIMLAGCIFLLVKKRKSERWAALAICLTALLLGVTVIVVFCNRYPHLVEKILKGMSDLTEGEGSRGDTYKGGWKLFCEYPVFGTGFYSCTFYQWGWVEYSFMPPRWHNTYIQLLASCGIVGLIAYAVHRAQTVWLWLKKPTVEKFFIALTVAALVGGSLLDCHFFNFGPGIIYATFLFLAERVNTPNDIKQEKPLLKI